MEGDVGVGRGAGPVQGRMAPRPADRWKQFSVTWGRAELLSRKTGPHVCLQEAAPEPHVRARCGSGLCLFNDAGARGRVFLSRGNSFRAMQGGGPRNGTPQTICVFAYRFCLQDPDLQKVAVKLNKKPINMLVPIFRLLFL